MTSADFSNQSLKPSKLFDLTGRTAIVTGGATGELREGASKRTSHDGSELTPTRTLLRCQELASPRPRDWQQLEHACTFWRAANKSMRTW